MDISRIREGWGIDDSQSGIRRAQYVLLLYILSISFQRFLYFEKVAYKIQLPEILFVLLVVFAYKFISKEIIRIMWPVWLFVGWIWVNAIYQNDFDAWMEVLGLTYLSGLAIITGSMVKQSDRKFIKATIIVFIVGIILQVVIGLNGYLLNYMGVKTPLLLFYENYPLVGNVLRMKGYCGHPVGLGNLIITALCFIPFVKMPFKKIVIPVLVVGLVLTYTKAILIALATFGIVATMFIERLYIKRLIFIASLSVLAVHVYLTHFTLPLTPMEVNQHNKAFYWNDHVVYTWGNKNIYTTSYYVLKQKSIEAVVQHPIMGVGGGNTNDFNLLNYNPNRDNKSIINSDPHSLYFGAAAEYGLIGLALLMLLLVLMGRTLFKLKDKLNRPEFFYGFLLLFLFLILEGFSSDIINNRQIWIFGGLASALFLNDLKVIKKSNVSTGN
ncbi:MAG: O-antigen ligase family protein [Chitinophagales bacterium]|nr:O-antigen ligase family protein [Chitinophagales bacterium]